MTTQGWMFVAATLLAGLGLWLMLPRGEAPGRRLGIVLSLVSLVLFAILAPRLGSGSADATFLILAAATLIAAVGTVTSSNPLHSAIWFAVVLVGTAALFLFQGAQFLGVATLVVYAGAIVVTFLFVLMLAQPGGQAYYDRLSWEALLSAATGAAMIGLLAIVISRPIRPAAGQPAPDSLPTQTQLEEKVLSPQHVAQLGGEMFGRHLIAVEVAGLLLLAALIGAMAISSQDGERRRGGEGEGGGQSSEPS